MVLAKEPANGAWPIPKYLVRYRIAGNAGTTYTEGADQVLRTAVPSDAIWHPDALEAAQLIRKTRPLKGKEWAVEVVYLIPTLPTHQASPRLLNIWSRGIGKLRIFCIGAGHYVPGGCEPDRDGCRAAGDAEPTKPDPQPASARPEHQHRQGQLLYGQTPHTDAGTHRLHASVRDSALALP